MLVREPTAGAVKTRLAPALGAAGAARLARAFTEDLCAALAPRFRLVLACAPDPDRPYFAALRRRHGVALTAQGDGDLGRRMARIAATALARAPRVVLMGSDVPTLPPAHVAGALRALARSRVVLGPSLDGGYHLLGLRAPAPDVFSRMRWSGDGVLAATLRRLRRGRVAHTVLSPWYDVDTPADLALLRRHLALLATLGRVGCPRTARLLGAGPRGRATGRRRR